MYTLRLYAHPPGPGQSATLLHELTFEASNEQEAIEAAKARAASAKSAQWARLRASDGSVPWYADRPFV